MSELEEILIGDSAHTAPRVILEALSAEQAHRAVPAAPHTIYQELWHIACWQQIALDWIAGWKRPSLKVRQKVFRTRNRPRKKTGMSCGRGFFHGSREAVAVAADVDRLDRPIRCPSRPGTPVRIMTVASSWRVWALITPITSGASCCCASCWARGRRRQADLPGEHPGL